MVENEFWNLKKKYDAYGGDEGIGRKDSEIERQKAVIRE